MHDQQFPLYRCSANGLNWYRIASFAEFTEVQRVGNRYILHRIKAETYPEKVRIMELVGLEHGSSECSRMEYENALSKSA
ncbi:MAG: hypothetical protein IPN44_06265 [Flavobacteriales bacterium]|nr:hypothetical protein [Flavobacteriales bacterium]